MTTVRGMGAVGWQMRHEIGSACFGPVSKESVLKMAELTGDFHPMWVMDQVAGEAGHAGLALHPAWISGLADTVIRRAFPECRVTYLSVTYHGEAVHTDRLSVVLTCQERETCQSEVTVEFSVKNGNNVAIADGVGRVVPLAPQLVRKCST